MDYHFLKRQDDGAWYQLSESMSGDTCTLEEQQPRVLGNIQVFDDKIIKGEKHISTKWDSEIQRLWVPAKGVPLGEDGKPQCHAVWDREGTTQ